MPLRVLLLPIFASTLLGACASSGASTSGDPAAADRGEDCIRVRAVRNFDALDDMHVWVEESGKRQFLLTMWSRCPDMRYARTIAFTGMMNVCPNNPGRINFSDGNQGYVCEIRYIERVGSKGEAEAILDDRRRLGE